MTKNVKKCIICGKEFCCKPSRNVVTCSRECRLIHLSQVHKGAKRSEDAKRKMSEGGKILKARKYKEKHRKQQRKVQNLEGLKRIGRQ